MIFPITSLLIWGGALFLSAVVVAQTPPSFTPSSDEHLIIEFGSTVIDPPGLQIGINGN